MPMIKEKMCWVFLLQKKKKKNNIKVNCLGDVDIFQIHSLGGIFAYKIAFAGEIIADQGSCDHSIMDIYIYINSMVISTYPSPGFQKFHTA